MNEHAAENSIGPDLAGPPTNRLPSLDARCCSD